MSFSFILVSVTLVLALSPAIRDVIQSHIKDVGIEFVTSTGLYRWYLGLEDYPIKKTKLAELRRADMRREVRVGRHDDIRRARELEDGVLLRDLQHIGAHARRRSGGGDRGDDLA